MTAKSDQTESTPRTPEGDLLLAKTAHEVNNLAMSVSANLKTLSSIWDALDCSLPQDNEELDSFRKVMPELLDEMRESLARMSEILKRVLDHASFQAESMEPVCMSSVLESALRIAADQFEEDVDVVKEIPVDMPRIMGDEPLLCQVFVNLILNAANAMRAGNGSARIAISADLSGDDLRISVSDTGPGMAPEIMEGIFKPFFTTRKGEGGTGLGLYVSREICIRHGGDLSAESSPGNGARFTVCLPVS